MKKATLLLFLCICSALSYSQNYCEITDYKISFGMDREEVLSILESGNKLRDQVLFNKEDEMLKKERLISLENITYFGYKFETCYFEFNDNNLLSSIIYYKTCPSQKDAVISLLAIEIPFNKIYGKYWNPDGNKAIMRWNRSADNSTLTAYPINSAEKGLCVVLINEIAD